MAIARKAPKAAAPKAAAPKGPAPKAPAAGKSRTAEASAPALQPTIDEAPGAALALAEDVQEQVRRLAEQNAEQTRLIYERLKTATESATGSLESSYAAASKGFGELNLKAIEAFRANADASFEYVKAMLAIKSVSEAVSLHGQHSRLQFEALSAQAKDLSSLAQKVAAETVEPIKSTLARSMQAPS